MIPFMAFRGISDAMFVVLQLRLSLNNSLHVHPQT